MHRQLWRVGVDRSGAVVVLGLMLLGLWQPSHAAEFLCAAGDVACLIATMQAANANGEVNTITLEAGLYTLTAVDNDTDGPTGLPSVTSTLTIQGAGAGSTIIERAASAPRFRLLHVAATGTLTLEGLTLQGGDLPPVINLEGFQDGGGGLRNRGTVRIASSILSHHTAHQGGGLFNSGTLLLTQSILNANLATDESGYPGVGGGIFNFGSLAIVQSTLSGNMATSGGGVSNFTLMTITGSALSGNAATSGGGISNSSGWTTIDSSTLSGNTASSGGGGIALATQSGVTLTNSTVGSNLATSGGGVSGGLGLVSVSIVQLQNTILAGNWVPPTGIGADCTSPGFSYGHNLIGDPTGCPITWEASDVTGDPSFGAFTDTGLPGQSYVPLHPESLAIDAGDTTTCPATDQLGQPRVGPCDIGAIEFQPETVLIRVAVFAEEFARLFVSATSSAPPDAVLVVTVPGCFADAPMQHLASRYVLQRPAVGCGNLNGQMVTVTSTYGGSASALLR